MPHATSTEDTDRLARSLEPTMVLLQDAPLGVYVVDSQFRMYAVNRGAEAAFTNVRPLIGREFGEVMRILWPESFAAEAVARFRHTLETGEPYTAPTLVERRADVRDVEAYEWELHRVWLPEQQYGVVCYFYDSTKMRGAEAALVEARRRSDAAMLAGEVGTYYWNVAEDYLSGDANFMSMFGLTIDEGGFAPLQDFMAVVHPDDRPAVTAAIEATLASDVTFRAEYRINHPNGERWVLSRGSVERDADGKPFGWAGVLVDITDRKRVEEQRRLLLESERIARADAERAGQIKDDFLATLSHELRTPLSAVLGWTQVLRMQHGDNAELLQGLQTIERNARAQSRIIEDLLDMSRIVSGKVRLDMQRADVAAVLQSALDTIRPTADARGVSLTYVPSVTGCIVGCDPNRLQQVFWNLLSNAVKFSARDGRVTVTLQCANGIVEVHVRDDGIGIAVDFLPLVFDRFRQADGSTTRQHGGLGLGLAIVKQLVDLHGGDVEAFSDGPGTGATFVVRLPLAIAPRAESGDESLACPSTNAADGPMTTSLHDVKVLVVDDEPDSRELIKRILERAGATVQATSAVDSAITLLESWRPDVVTSDIAMPDEDGYALIRRVRSLSRSAGGRTPAIALTAYARIEDRDAAIQAGFHEHLTKPVDAELLVATVGRVVGKRV